MENLRLKLIKSQDCQEMKWKNGLGLTKQIDIQPPNSPFPSNEFCWRLSSARISGNNSFSFFQGYDRILVVLEGNGLILNKTLDLKPLEPYSFSGEEPIECTLIGDEPVIDYGIIFKKGFNAKMDVLGAGNLEESELNLGHGFHYLTVIRGEFKIQGIFLKTGDTLMIESKGPTMMNLAKIMDGALIYVHVWK